MASSKKNSVLDAMEDRVITMEATPKKTTPRKTTPRKTTPRKTTTIPVQQQKKAAPGFNCDVCAPRNPVVRSGFGFGVKSEPPVFGGSGVRTARTAKDAFVPQRPRRPMDRSLQLKARRHRLGNGSSLRNLDIVVSKQFAAENDVSVSFGPGTITIRINEIFISKGY
jgi:hypothetical protein